MNLRIDNLSTYYQTRYIPAEFDVQQGSDQYHQDDFYADFITVMNEFIYMNQTRFIAPSNIINHDFFMVSENGKGYFVNPIDIEIVEHQLLKDNNLIYGKFNENKYCAVSQNYVDCYENFVARLEHLFFNYLANYADCLQKHFSMRESAAGKIMQYEVIKSMLTDITRILEKSHALMASDRHKQSVKFMLKGFFYLGKLTGGRAFLSKHIYEMQALLFILHEIYFRVDIPRQSIFCINRGEHDF